MRQNTDTNNTTHHHHHNHHHQHLIELLSTATDETTMCICLYDIGEFTRFYTGGRGITSTLGGKDVAMALIDHSNAEVARQALQCVSKVMVTNWEFMR